MKKNKKLITFVELAWNSGDINTYKYIVDKIIELNPDLSKLAKITYSLENFKHSKVNDSHFPDIDFD